MPYIEEFRRDAIGSDGYLQPNNPGDLNYLVTKLCWDYFRQNGGRYQQVNDVLGALDGARLEFYRRVAAPYEDKKIEQNGDVYV